MLALARRPASGPWAQLIELDLGRPERAARDRLAGALAGVQVAYHLAARVHHVRDVPGEDEAYRRVNVDGTRLLVEACLQAGVRRLVYFSSVKAMGERTTGWADESVLPAPLTPYGSSKLQAEGLVARTGSDGGLDTVILRLPLVYGRGAKGNLHNMFHAVLRGRFPPLPETGTRRSMIHVEDAAAAAIAAGRLDAPSGRTYLVAEREAYSARELLDAMRRTAHLPPLSWSVPLSLLRGLGLAGDAWGRVLGRPAPFDSSTLEKLFAPALYCSRRIAAEIGFEPSRTLGEGLAEMLDELNAAPEKGRG